MDHSHHQCSHDLRFCAQCDAPYCAKCKRDWAPCRQTHYYYPNTWWTGIQPYISGGTTTITNGFSQMLDTGGAVGMADFTANSLESDLAHAH